MKNDAKKKISYPPATQEVVVSAFEASSIRGITIFSVESVRRENVGSTMKSMKPTKAKMKKERQREIQVLQFPEF